MINRVTIALVVAFAVSVAGCSSMQGQSGAIMQAAQGDPAGSANTGTGSVTIGGGIPDEAKAAGIGLSP